MSNESEPDKPKKASLNQKDVPAYTLKETLRVARAIAEQLAKSPSSPLQVAAAMGIQPTTGQFRSLTSASIAYGLTEGSAWAEKIALTTLGKRIVAPTEEGDDLTARQEAVMRPRVLNAFLTRYSGNKWPRDDIGQNVLSDLGVPPNQAARALKLIHANAVDLGLITVISGSEYVDLKQERNSPATNDAKTPPEGSEDQLDSDARTSNGSSDSPAPKKVEPEAPRQVFISHGKNKKILEQIKVMLQLGDMKPVIAEEQETTAKPVPQKILDQMQVCDAAVISVTADEDQKNNEGYTINQNVLIEIGAAFVLYNERVILVWDRRVPVPSNLQGLYRCEYEGSELSWDAGTKLQKAVLNIKQGDKPS